MLRCRTTLDPLARSDLSTNKYFVICSFRNLPFSLGHVYRLDQHRKHVSVWVDWIGLDRIVSDWIGSDQIGLDRIGLDWIGLDWIGSDWIGSEAYDVYVLGWSVT